MNVLVTGGGGYLGTVLVRHLLRLRDRAPEDIHLIRVLDRFSYGTQPLATVAPDVEVIVGSITDPGVLDRALKGVDAVIHLAAVVGYPACEAAPEEAQQINVEGTRLLCERLDSRRLVSASTVDLYGKADRVVAEESPIDPKTRYTHTKAAAETLVYAAGGISVRFATLYGLSPRMRWDLLPHTLAREATTGEIRLFDGQAQRTFLHVEDAARACVRVLRVGVPGTVYNVGDELHNLTKLDLAKMLQKLTGCQITEVEGSDPEGRDCTVSYEKIHRLGWSSIHPFDLKPIVHWARVWR